MAVDCMSLASKDEVHDGQNYAVVTWLLQMKVLAKISKNVAIPFRFSRLVSLNMLFQIHPDFGRLRTGPLPKKYLP